MSPLERKRPQDEERLEARGQQVDLETKVCPSCREELAAWVKACPNDGATPVKREELPPLDDPLLARFLAEEPDDA
jgi:hypothetical protein